MAGHAGLVQKKVTAHRKGKTFQRSAWVRASGTAKKVGRFVGRHKGKIAGAAALTGAALLAARHHGTISHVARHGYGAHTAGVSRAEKFHKVAVSSGWAKGFGPHDWSKRTVAHAAKGYQQGFRKHMAANR